ncbi:MAG: glycine--tRNA ligase [Bacteroidota bacterium]|nr:glycine--tRNA ligase [Bacteroidota bacterium]MDP4232170.1 glycine--tRNA ligase [Bacteroidota bacterium]MDP4241122.1 glycine--tRNA ligase [Bacteroidota bacterium]MDP4286514.1 glycine--tRNA ligase [Bacteroidota bacterium]
MAQVSSSQALLEKIVSLAKRRGFIFQSSEIYGGLNGCWDFGPLGVEMLRNVKNAWWQSMTQRGDIEGIDASILMHPRVWEASGHVQNFSDPMVDCRECKMRYRVDHLFSEMSEKRLRAISKATQLEGILAKTLNMQSQDVTKDQLAEILLGMIEKSDTLFSDLVEKELVACPNCGRVKTLTPPRNFNLMFETHIGPVKDDTNAVFLRPETAQGIFVNFLNVMQSSRQKIPFGICQIGKSFRNEINTKNFLFRTREFEQMEMQFFCKKGTDEQFFEDWRETRWNWWQSLGMPAEKMRFKPHEKLAHYAKAAGDIEFLFPFGFGEIEGIHNRTDFDLTRHTEFSGKSLQVHDEVTKEKYTPYVVETAAGATRGFMALLCNAYEEEQVEGEQRVVMRLHPSIAPIKVAVLPLVNKEGMPEIAQKLEKDLRKSMKSFYDDSGAVGRRYRRMDEIGTPFAVTIDSDTLVDQTVTIRERDSMQQIRIASDKVREYISQRVR